MRRSQPDDMARNAGHRPGRIVHDVPPIAAAWGLFVHQGGATWRRGIVSQLSCQASIE